MKCDFAPKFIPAVLFFFLTLIFVINGCQYFRDVNASGPKRFLIPWTQNGDEYRLQIVEINSLENLSRMEGKYARVRFNQSNDSVAPEAQFIQNSEGVFIAQDSGVSLQLVTVYAHMEKLGELDVKLGLQIPRPRLVSIESKIKNKKGESELNNALYFGSLDLIAIAPNTLDTLPISMNAGVLAHEYFHAIFHHLVFKFLDASFGKVAEVHDDFDTPPVSVREGDLHSVEDESADIKLAEKIVLMALNEGLADYWAWIYSGHSDFLEKSLHGVKSRRISELKTSLVNPQFFKRSKRQSQEDFYVSRTYLLGTRYAGAMRSLTESLGKEETLRRLVNGLSNLAQLWKSMDAKRRASPNILLASLFGQKQLLSPSICCWLNQVTAREFESFGLLDTCEEEGLKCTQNLK